MSPTAFLEDRWHDARTGARTARYGSGRQWRVRYADPDGRERSKSFARKTDATRFRSMVEAELLRGTYLDPDGGKVLLRAYAAQWLASRRSLDVSSRRTIGARIDRHILPVLGDRRLDQLARSPSIVSGWLAGVTAGPVYTRDILSTLSAILGAAVDDGLITRNPCRTRSVRAEQPVKRKLVPWTAAQVTAVREALPERYRAMTDCGSGLGLRQGEIFGLEEGAVEFLRRRVVVRLQVRLIGGVRVFAAPKGRKEREVRLPGPVALALSEHVREFPPRLVTLPWREPGGEPHTARLLFTTPRGGALNRDYFDLRTWRPARRAAGLADTRENGMHALRHYYASRLLAGRVDIKRVQAALGHHSAAFTLDVYGHLMPDLEDRALREIEDALSAGNGPETAHEAGESK